MNTLVDRLYSFLRSLRLAAVLLIILALLSVAGGIIPQGRPADFYFSQMPSVARLILWLGFDHLFTSRLFLIVVALFTTNLTVCTVHRLGNEFAKPRAMRRHGPDLLHLGLIIIIFGSILTSRTRTEHFFTAGEGQHIHLPDRQVLSITRLEQETYEGGRVRTWITEGSLGPAFAETAHDGDTGGDTLGVEGYAAEAGALGIRMPSVPLPATSTEKGGMSTSSTESIAAAPRQVQPQGTPVTIKVNAPYRGKGYTIYQYDWKTFSLPILADETGTQFVLQSGRKVATPDGFVLFMATEQPPAPKGAPVEPEAVFLVEQQGTRTLVRARPGDRLGSFLLKGYEIRSLSGLKIKSDPWFPLVLAGIILAMAGILLTYFRKLKGLSA